MLSDTSTAVEKGSNNNSNERTKIEYDNPIYTEERDENRKKEIPTNNRT